MTNSDIYYIEVVGKALEVLKVFARASKRQMSLQEISNEVRLNRNAVFRILYTLVEHGYVIKENSRYRLGSELFRLCDPRVRHTDVIAVASPYLDLLREQLGETVNLGVLEEGAIHYIDVRESRNKFRLAERVGASDPLHCTALGKAHLAYLPRDEVRSLMRLQKMARYTEHTITSLTGLFADLEATRARGYSLDREESLLGAYCVGIPIVGRQGRPIAAISVSGPVTRFNDDHLPAACKALQEASSAVHSRLGLTAPQDVTGPASSRAQQADRNKPKSKQESPVLELDHQVL